jgi:hypothetical protein
VETAHPSWLYVSIIWSSQVKLLITNNAFFILQRATEQSKTGIIRHYGVAEAPPGFQAGWSDCMYFFSLSSFIFCVPQIERRWLRSAAILRHLTNSVGRP